MSCSNLLEPSFCGRLCLALLHSLWQVALLAFVARLIEVCRRKRSVEIDYLLHMTVLLLGMVCLPITFWIIDARLMNAADVPYGNSSSAAAGSSEIDDASPSTIDPSIDKSQSTVFVHGDGRVASVKVATKLASQTQFVASWVAVAYLAGVLVMLARIGIAIVQAERLRGRARTVADGFLVDSLNALCHQWSLRVTPILATTESIVLPKLIGLTRPVILLPASALSGLSAAELEMILIHELAHVRRYDLLGNLLQRVVEVVLFFNPTAWYLSRRISLLREYCCDETACRTLADRIAEPRLQYATTLLRTVELASPKKFESICEVAVALQGRSPSELRRRIASLLGEPLSEPIRFSRGGIVALVLSTLCIFSWPMISRTDAQADKPETAAAPGMRIEVLALGTHKEDPQLWWQADGQRINDVPFTWKQFGETDGGVNTIFRKIAFRIHHLPKDAAVRFHMGDGCSSAGAQLMSDGKPLENHWAQYFAVPPDLKSIDLTVNIAKGDWKTVASVTGYGQAAMDNKKLHIVFSEATQLAAETRMIISHNCFDRDFRLIAVTKDDKTHTSSGGGGASAGEIYQITVNFPDLPLAEIKHFEFQVREFKAFKIEDLSLEPASQ